MKKSGLMMLVATLTWMIVPEPAEAVRGVKYIHFDPSTSLCQHDQGLPCDPAAGIGEANKLYVHQSEIDGQWVFDFVAVPGVPDGYLWMAPSYGAECKTGYSVHKAYVRLGFYQGEGKGPIEVYGANWHGSVGFGSNQKTIHDDAVDLQVPVDFAFGEVDGLDSSVFGFASLEEVLDYGEDRIADRMTEGRTEEDARSEGFSVSTFLSMHGVVVCRGNSFGRKFWMARAEWLPLEIVFVGLGQTAELNQAPLRPESPTDDLTWGTAVTQAFLSVQQDALDSCRLRLSGVFTATEPTDVTYRFVDEIGRASQSFTASIDQTQTVMIDHFYDLPEAPSADGEIDDYLGGGRGSIGGLKAPQNANETGTFQLEVLEPHGYWSNVAGYNVEPCVPGPGFDGGGLKSPTRVPPGGHPPSSRGKVAR